MTSPIVVAKIDALLAEAENTNEWGGGENEHGGLEPGSVDWDTLRSHIMNLLTGLEQEKPCDGSGWAEPDHRPGGPYRCEGCARCKGD